MAIKTAFKSYDSNKRLPVFEKNIQGDGRISMFFSINSHCLGIILYF